MARWTVFKAQEIPMHKAGQSFVRLGTVEAENWDEAADKAHREFAHETNQALPNEGLIVRAARMN